MSQTRIAQNVFRNLGGVGVCAQFSEICGPAPKCEDMLELRESFSYRPHRSSPELTELSSLIKFVKGGRRHCIEVEGVASTKILPRRVPVIGIPVIGFTMSATTRRPCCSGGATTTRECQLGLRQRASLLRSRAPPRRRRESSLLSTLCLVLTRSMRSPISCRPQ